MRCVFHAGIEHEFSRQRRGHLVVQILRPSAMLLQVLGFGFLALWWVALQVRQVGLEGLQHS